jgi:hypothetical protein
MSVTHRLRAAAFALALSTVLVAGTTGTALALEDLDCADFTHREDAQAVLDEDRSDPHRLDGGPDGPADGLACESLPLRGAPATTPVTAAPEATTPDTTPPAAPSARAATADRDCPDFATQADAQAALENRAGDPERLDADDDGVACEQHFGTDGRQVAVFPLGGVATGGTARS